MRQAFERRAIRAATPPAGAPLLRKAPNIKPLSRA